MTDRPRRPSSGQPYETPHLRRGGSRTGAFRHPSRASDAGSQRGPTAWERRAPGGTPSRALLLLPLLPLAGALMLSAPAIAQGAGPDAGTRPSRSCFRPAPLPKCSSFWTTEFHVGRMLTSPRDVEFTDPGFTYTDAEGNVVVEPPSQVRYSRDRSTVVGWELGAMQNHRPGRARGGALFLAVPFNEGTPQVGVRGRYRWWSVQGATVDVSPGVYVTREDGEVGNTGAHRRIGASVRGSVAPPGDWIALVGEVDLSPGHMGLQASGRLGSIPGAVTGIVAPLGVLLLLVFTYE